MKKISEIKLKHIHKYSSIVTLTKAFDVSLTEAQKIFDKVAGHYSVDVEDDDIEKLKSAFTFNVSKSQKELDEEIEIERVIYETNLSLAKKWFDSLSPGEKKHVKILQESVKTYPAGYEGVTYPAGC